MREGEREERRFGPTNRSRDLFSKIYTRRPRPEIFAPAFACVIRLSMLRGFVAPLFRICYTREGGSNSINPIIYIYIFYIIFDPVR